MFIKILLQLEVRDLEPFKPLLYKVGWGRDVILCLSYSVAEGCRDTTWRYNHFHSDLKEARESKGQGSALTPRLPMRHIGAFRPLRRLHETESS